MFELDREEPVEEIHYPVQGCRITLRVALDMGSVQVPPRACRRLAAKALQRLLEGLDEDALLPAGPAESEARSEAAEWEGLDLRIAKSAHRLVLEVANREGLLARDLVGALSPPTIARLLRDGDPANDYLRRFVTVSIVGRQKALHLTGAGRKLARRILAGDLPFARRLDSAL